MVVTILIALISLAASLITYFLSGIYTTWWLFFLIIFFFIGYFVICAGLYIFFFVYVVSWFDNKGKEYEKSKPYYYWTIREISWFSLFFANTKINVRGLEKLPKDNNFLFTFNHTSNWDGMVLFKVLSKFKLTFLQKKEAIYTRFTGTFLHRSGFVLIDRDNLASRIKALKRCSHILKENKYCLGVSPEGTRNRKREYRILPFQNGAFAIAKDAHKPIVLIGMKNVYMVKRNAPWKRTVIDFSILDVINVETIDAKTDKELNEYSFNKYQEYLKEDTEEFI